MTSDEIAIMLVNFEDDVEIADDEGKVNFYTIVEEFAEWLKTTGECKDFESCFKNWKRKLDGKE